MSSLPAVAPNDAIHSVVAECPFGYVYLIEQVHDQSIVKIGWAMRPTDRVRTLRTGSAQQIALVHWTRGDRHTEHLFHECFASLRCRGEWFADDGRIRQFFDVIAAFDCGNDERAATATAFAENNFTNREMKALIDVIGYVARLDLRHAEALQAYRDDRFTASA